MLFSNPSAIRIIAVAAVLGAVTLFNGPVCAGPPFRTDDPEPVDYQHWEFYLFSTGTKTNDGWAGFLPAVEVNYGVLPNLQLHAIIPQGYNAPSNGQPTGFGLGDTELGFKYRFITPGEGDWYPQVAIFPLIEVPTGNQDMGFSTGHVQVYIPIWLQKEFGDWTVYGGGGYWINPGAGNKNWGFTGIAVWRKITEQLNLGIEVFHQTPATNATKPSTGFNVGAIYDLSENWHLLTSGGTGIQNANSTNAFSYYAGILLTF